MVALVANSLQTRSPQGKFILWISSRDRPTTTCEFAGTIRIFIFSDNTVVTMFQDFYYNKSLENGSFYDPELKEQELLIHHYDGREF